MNWNRWFVVRRIGQVFFLLLFFVLIFSVFYLTERKTLTRNTFKYSWLFINWLSLVCDLSPIGTCTFCIATVRFYFPSSECVCDFPFRAWFFSFVHIFQYFNTPHRLIELSFESEKNCSKRIHKCLTNFSSKLSLLFWSVTKSSKRTRWPCWKYFVYATPCTCVCDLKDL